MKLILVTGVDSRKLLSICCSKEFEGYKYLQFPELDVQSRFPLSEYEQYNYIMAQFFNSDTLICTQSNIIFDSVRLLVKNKLISNNDVEIRYYDGKDTESKSFNIVRVGNYIVLKLDEDGRLNYWPDGFFDTSCYISSKLM
jgi:hypothetical protein